MVQYEYKVVAAPERTEKVKGLRNTADRFAHTLTGALNAMAREGWEFVRAETLPCEERSGLMRRARISEQHVLVFRRPVAELAEQVAPRAEPAPARTAPTLSAGRAAHHEEPLLSRRGGDPDAEEPPRG